MYDTRAIFTTKLLSLVSETRRTYDVHLHKPIVYFHSIHESICIHAKGSHGRMHVSVDINIIKYTGTVICANWFDKRRAINVAIILCPSSVGEMLCFRVVRPSVYYFQSWAVSPNRLSCLLMCILLLYVYYAYSLK